MKANQENNEQNLKSLPCGKNKITQIDVKGGQLTFGQRIYLGKVFESEGTDFDKFIQTFEILHEKPLKSQYKNLLNYFNEIIEGLIFWIEQENTKLKYTPTIEEKKAGVQEFSQKVGEFSTIKALAKAYSKDPDDILEWKYGKVFGILYTDLEEYKYNVRYNKIIEEKFKK